MRLFSSSFIFAVAVKTSQRHAESSIHNAEANVTSRGVDHHNLCRQPDSVAGIRKTQWRGYVLCFFTLN